MERGKPKGAAELDDHLGISMMEPENEIPKRDLPWWSKELHKAHLLVKYWKAKHFYTIRGEPFHENLLARENELLDVNIHQGDHTRPISSQIRKAKKNRRMIRARSYEKRQQFLEKLADDTATKMKTEQKSSE